MNGPLLIGRDVRRSFGSTVALDGASVEIDAGEIVAIMGPSGSGNPTMHQCTPSGGLARNERIAADPVVRCASAAG